MQSSSSKIPHAFWQKCEGSVLLTLSGNWTRDSDKPVISGYQKGAWPDRFMTDEMGEFDSRLPAYLLKCFRKQDTQEIPSWDGLPEALCGLMELAVAVPDCSEARKENQPNSFLVELGLKAEKVWKSFLEVVEFSGETLLAMNRFLIGRARFRSEDFLTTVRECGAQALPIVSLISFLIGMILAFVGNAQLANVGARIYVADLVGIAIVREMGVVMTAIIMSGRTGAAFTAHLGSMMANEEIDALRTFGFQSFDFLVLPRVLALTLMMPLLTIYANFVGILGGMLVAWTVGITPTLFWTELLTAINPVNCSLGVIKSVFFGITIAVVGCMQGMKAGKSSAAVGEATTRSVVASITGIVLIDSIFAVIFTIFDI